MVVGEPNDHQLLGHLGATIYASGTEGSNHQGCLVLSYTLTVYAWIITNIMLRHI